METNNTKLIILSVIIIFLNGFSLNGFVIFLDFLVILEWIYYHKVKKNIEKLDVSFSLTNTRFFIGEKVKLTVYLNQNFECFLSIPEIGISKIPLKDKVTLTYTSNKRGIKKINYLFLKHETFLFNLIKKLEKGIEVIFFPEFEPVNFRKEELLDLIPNLKSNIRLLEDTSYFVGIRKYQNDPIRKINWKISAKLNDLYVKNYEYTSQGKIIFSSFLNLHSDLKNKEAWKYILPKYVEDSIYALNSMIKDVGSRNIPLKLFIDSSKGIKKNSFENWIDCFEILATSYGGYKFNYEIYNEIKKEIRYNDTLVIITMFLGEKDLKEILKIREIITKIIVLVMPFGFRRTNIKKFKSFLEIPYELKRLKKHIGVLRENNVHIVLYDENNLLQEGLI
ncbi:hypothetical protein SU69_04810 [Thermosipho melanesiensis]|uniref:DUF58 domain-containing protein n=1 Tax=Thermosipho melanesiensis TaxID=46541 RepID=A0ABN4UXQ0_9BACT|nr:hypothetical protein BW47_05045 [Thermosipho melanesiensis]OOC36769.1 hypothetical protein SU68_04865 [Thermosipho melanesiensis]OOC38470.1 hypothetical protein SU69_04810 [Thermosipho melanesiensis]OOC38932.1 hypothetical protein SU70_04810 [Thermosipho melanesiensis]OOC41570.1 hypothetical protein SU71_04800 [Thermosipho melanesiensis]